MTKKIVVANWKMNGSSALVEECLTSWREFSEKSIEIVFCPPFVYLSQAQSLIKGSSLKLGGQDCHFQGHGSFTGDVSAAHLKEMGCTYVLVGHSERRRHHGEASALIKAKVEAAFSRSLIPILCIGENEDERRGGRTLAVLTRQIEEGLPEKRGNFCLSYEPIWSIGTGKTPKPEEVSEIFQHLQFLFPESSSPRFLYGGSVTAENCRSFLDIPLMSGLLVGGVSLNQSLFRKLLQNVVSS